MFFLGVRLAEQWDSVGIGCNQREWAVGGSGGSVCNWHVRECVLLAWRLVPVAVRAPTAYLMLRFWLASSLS